MRPRSGSKHTGIKVANARDLPDELLTLVLSKLPEDDLSRHQASQVCRAWRDAERACERRVELRLTSQAAHSQLAAFAVWGSTRSGAVAATLSAASADPGPEDDVLFLTSLAAIPRLTTLVLNLDLPVNFATVGQLTALTALRVAIPQLNSLEYSMFEDDDNFQVDMIEPEFDVKRCSTYASCLTLTRLLKPGLLPLRQLRDLDVDQVVPPRGDVRALGVKLPNCTTLPWLTCLTQLTRLKARVFSVNESAWSLPRLRELHVCGGFRGERVDAAEEIVMANDYLALECQNVGNISPQVTKLVLESCDLRGEVLTLKASVMELVLLRSVSLSEESELLLSGPGLSKVCVVIDRGEDAFEYNDDPWGGRWPPWEPTGRAFRLTFKAMPQLTELVLDDGRSRFAWGGVSDVHIQHCRCHGFPLLPALAHGTKSPGRWHTLLLGRT